jgi:hypothetical protein
MLLRIPLCGRLRRNTTPETTSQAPTRAALLRWDDWKPGDAGESAAALRKLAEEAGEAGKGVAAAPLPLLDSKFVAMGDRCGNAIGATTGSAIFFTLT